MRFVSSVPRASGAGEVDAKPQCRQLLVQAWVHLQGRMNKGPLPLNIFTMNSIQVFNEKIKTYYVSYT